MGMLCRHSYCTCCFLWIASTDFLTMCLAGRMKAYSWLEKTVSLPNCCISCINTIVTTIYMSQRCWEKCCRVLAWLWRTMFCCLTT